MHHNFEHYQARDSLIHHLDPRAKVVATLLFILATVLLPDGAWLGFVLSWLTLLLMTHLAQLPYKLIFLRALIILPFLLAAGTILFSATGEPLLTWQMGAWTVTITDNGIIRFLSIFIRSWLAVQTAILLTATTPFPDLMHALSHLHIPAILIGIISFMYRYLFVLVDEAMRLMRARQARSARLPNSGKHGGSLLWRAKVTGSMVGQLFVRSLDRSEAVYNGMLARGYQGQLLTMNPHIMGQRDWLFLGTAVSSIIFIQIITYL